MLHAQASERELIDQFLAALRSLPEVQAELERAAAPELDAQLALDVAGKPIHALVELRKAVYPARRPSARLADQGPCPPATRRRERRRAAGDPGRRSISPGAKGCFEPSGSGTTTVGAASTCRHGEPTLRRSAAARRCPLDALAVHGRRAQVLHGLLVRHQDWFGVKDLAEQTLVSPATASQVLTEMERFDWLESRGQGPSKQRHLREPAALLDAWAKQLS